MQGSGSAMQTRCMDVITWHKRKVSHTVLLVPVLLLLAGRCLSLRDEHVIALTNTTTGIVVSVLSRNGLDYSIPDPHFISPACGNNFLRCQDLKVVSYALTNTTSQHITLVPVVGGVGMFEFHYNGFQLSFHKQHIAELDCNPMSIHKLKRTDTYYVLCLNRTVLNGHIVTLNRENSSVKLSQTPHLNIFVENPSHLSNFVYVIFGSEEWIYFAKGASLYRISPSLTPSYSVVGNLIFNGYECDTETIVYARDGTLIAFCHDINNVSAVLYFDLNKRRVDNATIFAERQPYVCPNPDVRLSVNKRDSSIQYGLWSQSSDIPNANNLAEFTIPSENFASGVCFTGPENSSLLAYSDRREGVFLFDTGTHSFKHLSSVGCPNSFCEPLLVYDSRYVAIREQQGNATVKIIDTVENCSAIINGRASADLLTMIYDLNPRTEPTVPTEITWWFVGAACLIGVLGIPAAILYQRQRRKRVRNHEEAQEEGGPMRNVNVQDGVQDEPEEPAQDGIHDEPEEPAQDGIHDEPERLLIPAEECLNRPHTGMHDLQSPVTSSAACAYTTSQILSEVAPSSATTDEVLPGVAVAQDTHPTPTSFVIGHALPLPQTSDRVFLHTTNIAIQDEHNRQNNNSDNNNIP